MITTARGSIIFGLALALGFAALAQQAPAPGNAATTAANALGPRITFANTLYDFGRARAGEPVKHTYEFTNTGDATLILTNVQPQCGCTTAGQWSREVAPGMAGTIPIQFNTTSYNGPVFKQITVVCNDKTRNTLFLQLKGTVFKTVDISPPMAMLSLSADAETASATVTITNNMPEPLEVWGAESSNKAFGVELSTNTPGRCYKLLVSVLPTASAPGMPGQITLHTSWTNQPVLNISAYANRTPIVSLIPSRLVLPPGPLAAPHTPSVTIQNNSTNALSLSDASINAPGVEVQLKETQPGRTFTASATFPQGFQLQPGQQLELTMKSSNPKYPVVKVPITQMPHAGAQMLPKPPTPSGVNQPSPLRPVKTTAADPPPVPSVPTVR
ncbi:MAG TPA: DUF1573 domain-containing protein [Candidatus Acidoferrum sp.]|nr:DUF1573 domain-containing protein [Candidatus Acidoferrum sp.]